MTMVDEILFHEQQRPWVGFMIIAAACCALTAGITAFVLMHIFYYDKRVELGSRDIYMIVLGSLAIAIGGAGLVVAFLAKMTTDLRTTGLQVRIWPLRPKKIDLKDAVSVKSVQYRPIGQYGGWGIRWAPKGKAYNMRGNRGVRLDYADGRHLLIGSQRPDELAAAIEQFRTGSS